MKAKLPLIVSLCVLTLALWVKAIQPAIVTQLQLKVFDTFQLSNPRVYTSQPVRIIDIDDESLARIGQWPWPRNTIAALIDKLTEHGAAAIAFDMVFAEPDRTSPEYILPLWGQSEKLSHLVTDIPNHDDMLEQSIRNSNVVTGLVLTQDEPKDKPLVKAGYSFAGDDPKQYLDTFSGSVLSLQQLEAASTGNGAFNSIPDQDGIIRRMPLAFMSGNQLVPSLSAEALRIAQGASSYIIKSSGASGEESYNQHTGIVAIKIGQFEIPTDASGKLWIYYSEFVPDRYIPAWKVLEDSFNGSLVNGNILYIGTSAPGLKDIRATPFNPLTSGVEVHAQAVEQILAGEFLTRPDWIHGAEISLMVIVGIILIIFMAKLPAVWGAIFTICTLAVAIYFSWLAFFKYKILIDPITPSIAIIFLYLSESLSRYISTEKEKKQVRHAFSHYMSPDMVSELASNPHKLVLGGETKNLTLLFCDIRGFTTLSEKFTAEDLTIFLNRFLTPMTEIILSKKGTIDKYIGDCIMAFWNAPLDDPEHQRNACLATLNMLYELKELNVKLKKEALESNKEYIPIDIGIGINTGSCCVGNMGSDQRFDYSVIGDDVNLAARLEGQSKTYSVAIVIGEKTYEAASDLAILEIDVIRVKGKTLPVHIYTLLGDGEFALDKNFQELRKSFNKMLASYRSQHWETALSFLDDAHGYYIKINSINRLNGLFELYRERINDFIKNPPNSKWDGVYVATAK